MTYILGQRGGGITMCEVISNGGPLYRHAILGPYNTARVLQSLGDMHSNILQQWGESGQPE